MIIVLTNIFVTFTIRSHIKFKNQDAYSRINNKLDELLEAIKIFSSFGVYSLNFDFKKNKGKLRKNRRTLW